MKPCPHTNTHTHKHSHIQTHPHSTQTHKSLTGPVSICLCPVPIQHILRGSGLEPLNPLSGSFRDSVERAFSFNDHEKENVCTGFRSAQWPFGLPLPSVCRICVHSRVRAREQMNWKFESPSVRWRLAPAR